MLTCSGDTAQRACHMHMPPHMTVCRYDVQVLKGPLPLRSLSSLHSLQPREATPLHQWRWTQQSPPQACRSAWVMGRD